MKKQSVLILGYSSRLSGGVSKVTNTLMEHMPELELHPVLLGYFPLLYSIPISCYSFFSYLLKLGFGAARYRIVMVMVGSKGDVIRTLPYIWFALLLRKAVYIQYHKSSDILLNEIKNPLLLKLVLFSWNRVSLHCHLSSALEAVHRQYLNEEARNVVIPNAISEKWLATSPLPYASRTRDIVFFGRWSAEKGVHDLTRAMSCLDEEWICEIYSNAPKEEAAKNCLFSPWVDEDRVYEIMKTAKLFVLPSYAEAYPTVLLEALACGTPFIATNIAGIPDIARESGGGILFEAGDVSDLAVKINTLLGDQSNWKKLAENRNPWIHEHNIKRITEKWRAVFNDLPARRNH